MITWRKGRELLKERLRSQLPRPEDFVRTTIDVPRVEGRAVFLTADPQIVPSSILHNLKHNRVLHELTVFLTIVSEEVPRVERAEKVEVTDLGEGFSLVEAHFGFYETPSVPYVLALAREKGLDVPLEGVSFFLARERIRTHRKPGLSYWRERLFAFLSRNSLDATTYFGIPPSQVVEIGTQVQL
jgi:KUP system potassium uptake protein